MIVMLSCVQVINAGCADKDLAYFKVPLFPCPPLLFSIVAPARSLCYHLCSPLSRIIFVSCIHAASLYHPYTQQRPKKDMCRGHNLGGLGFLMAPILLLLILTWRAHVVCLPPTTPRTSHASLPHNAHIHAHTRMHTNGCALIGTRKETVNVMTQTLSVGCN